MLLRPPVWPGLPNLQPVLPFALMVCRLKPPTNEPHGILAALSRSPTFLLVMPTVRLVAGPEQTSKVGSMSWISVRLPSGLGTASPSAKMAVVNAADPTGGTTVPSKNFAPAGAVKTAPLVWPAHMLSKPGVDGP